LHRVRPEAAKLREGECGSVLYFAGSSSGPAWCRVRADRSALPEAPNP